MDSDELRKREIKTHITQYAIIDHELLSIVACTKRNFRSGEKNCRSSSAEQPGGRYLVRGCSRLKKKKTNEIPNCGGGGNNDRFHAMCDGVRHNGYKSLS